jgi:phosphatidylinositol alpha-mannosyltransferase
MKFNGNSVRTPRPTNIRAIEKALSSIDPDVIHVQMPYSPFFGAKVIALASKKTKIVGTWHTFPAGRLQRNSHYLLYLMIKNTLKRVSVTIGVSAPTAQFADSIYRTKSIVIPNPVEITRFSEKTLNNKRTNKHIVYLGRFDERKGPKLLIEALSELKYGGYDMSTLSITMAGKGPDLEECEKLALEYGLTIDFTGFVDELVKPELLASADISVFPSTGGEAFGISVVEAMASGASIVLAGDNPGYRSILGEKSELLFDPRNTHEFATRLKYFLDLSEAETTELKAWLKESAKQYNVVEVCKLLLKVYQA